MFAGAVGLEQEMFSKAADEHLAARGPDREQGLMLLRRDPGSGRRLLAEMQELSQLVADTRQRMIMLITQLIHSSVSTTGEGFAHLPSAKRARTSEAPDPRRWRY